MAIPVAICKRPSRGIKGGTASTRKHRFESFNERLAKVKIAPLHTNRQRPFIDENCGQNFSHFKDTLDRWKDTNASANFTALAWGVAKQSETLPQVLHHQGGIFDTLNKHLQQCDALSAEPLLELLSSLAHDLGVHFKPHLLTAIETLKSLSTGHVQIEVIEWSFNCMAWLFKYLSRLLLSNPVPIFQALSPLLGNATRKHYVIRFAAESLSYLLTKAAMRSSKDPEPLNKIISFLCDDLRISNSDGASDSYQEGLMTLFAESLKGVNNGLHSCAVNLYRTLLQKAVETDADGQSRFFHVFEGTTIGIVHHTTSQTAKPIFDVILTDLSISDHENTHTRLCERLARLLLLVVGTRKGTRVADWARVLDTLLILLKQDEEDSTTITLICQAASVVIQYAPRDTLLLFSQEIMHQLQSERLRHCFLEVCIAVNELSSERFQELLLPTLQRFVAHLSTT